MHTKNRPELTLVTTTSTHSDDRPDRQRARDIEHDVNFDAHAYCSFTFHAACLKGRSPEDQAFIAAAMRALDPHGLLAARYELRKIEHPVTDSDVRDVETGTSSVSFFDDDGNVDETVEHLVHYRDTRVSTLITLYCNFAGHDPSVLEKVRDVQDRIDANQDATREADDDLDDATNAIASDPLNTTIESVGVYTSALGRLEALRADYQRLADELEALDPSPSQRYRAILNLEAEEFSSDSAI